MLSFSETRAHQVVQQKSEQFMIYNQKQLTRIYPSAYRIDSSNFNPLPYWNAGCQLGVYASRRNSSLSLLGAAVLPNSLKLWTCTVALNYQSEGRIMQLNRAKFKTNGNCGYVLKPQQMCKGVCQFCTHLSDWVQGPSIEGTLCKVWCSSILQPDFLPKR